MTVDLFLPILSLGTLLAVTAFGYFSSKAVLDRMDDPDARKSTLASDKASDGKPADV